MAGLTDPERYAYLAEGNAKQARKRVAAKVLVRDEHGQVLLVNPTYKAHWDLPGGMAEANESPLDAAGRELREELDLTTQVGRLLVLDWVGPNDPWDDQLLMVFDGGTLSQRALTGLQLGDAELSDYKLVRADDAGDMLRPDMHDTLKRAIEAADTGITSYSERTRHW